MLELLMQLENTNVRFNVDKGRITLIELNLGDKDIHLSLEHRPLDQDEQEDLLRCLLDLQDLGMFRDSH